MFGIEIASDNDEPVTIYDHISWEINMKDISYRLGISGEDIAAEYLNKRGYKIIERNFRVPGGEIDIVAKDGRMLVFIEVKNYSYTNFYLPLYSITEKKKMRIYRTAEEYLYRRDVADNDCRFDAVLIHRNDKGKVRIDIIKNAFG